MVGGFGFSIGGLGGPETKEYDVVIVGSGPAGMTAALYTSRAQLSTLLVEKNVHGGQMTNTEEIENYPGYPTIKGSELASIMFEHALKFGAEHAHGEVTGLEKEGDRWAIVTSEGSRYLTYAAILATGAENKRLGVPGEDRLSGRGVSWCAVCDGAFFKDKDVLVIGGGDSAVEEATYLTRFARKVTVVHRRDKFRAIKTLQDRFFRNERTDVIWNSVVTEILGEKRVDAVRLKNLVTGEEWVRPTDGLFIYIGVDPMSAPFRTLGITDEQGYIVTDESMNTAIPGVFAAGDVRKKQLKQVATAVGDGSIAAMSALAYVEAVKEGRPVHP